MVQFKWSPRFNIIALDKSSIYALLGVILILIKHHVKVVQQCMQLVLIGRVCFSEEFDILFVIFGLTDLLL